MKKGNRIIQGDCLEKLKELDDNSVDSVVTDPPYHLVSIVKRFGKEGSAPAKEGTDGSFKRLSGGFMGKTWDGVDENGMGIAMNVDMWKECLRVLKPGGHLLSFGGTRTYHRMASAIEDAGFEVRDMIEWVYGSGFPKSRNIGKDIEKINVGGIRNLKQIGTKKGIKCETGTKGYSYSKEYVAGVCMGGKQISGDIPVYEINNEWEGWGTALKPSHESICMARKPLSEKTVAENCLKWGTGGINIDESRVDFDLNNKEDINAIAQWERQKRSGVKVFNQEGTAKLQQFNQQAPLGRFPANLIHDNSEEVRECFPNAKGASSQNNYSNGKIYRGQSLLESETKLNGHRDWYNDDGNASRFFKSIIYTAKASKSERNKGCEEIELKGIGVKGNGLGRVCEFCGVSQLKPEECLCEVKSWINPAKNGNNHPTVKPIALMEYLINMVTREGQTVLDPFAGSGTTLIAAKKLGRKYIGIELEPEYVKIAKARIDAVPERII